MTTRNLDHLMSMPPEDDAGHTEYKYRLINLSNAQKIHLASQLAFRLHSDSDYHGQAIYDIGLTDDGFPLGLSETEMTLSLKSLEEVVSLADDAVICAIDKHEVTHYADSEEDLIKNLMLYRIKDPSNPNGNVTAKWKYVESAKARGALEFKRWVAEIIIRKDLGAYWETRLGIAGNVDCGKSTLLGVLTSGEYDNGRGSARLSVMTHEHEIDTGRTSSVSQKIVGFSADGSSVNAKLAKKNHVKGSKIEWSDIVKASSKIITFFDLAGHLKYLSQTVRGLSSNELDYVLIIVGANMVNSVGAVGAVGAAGVSGKWINMTREHMEISLALGMPCIVVITKIDMVDESIKNATLGSIKKLIKKRFAHFTVDTPNDVRTCIDLMSTGKVVPIVQVSNVTGQGHDILRKLLHFLPPRKEYDSKSPPIMQIQDIFRKVEGTSTVIAGMLTSGEVHVGEGARPATTLKLGPLADGTFLDAKVRTIYCKKVNVSSVKAGKYICIGLPKALDGSRLRKNMFAVGAGMKPHAIWEFWADVKLSKAESTCVKPGYTPHCYIGHIRQTCKMLRIIEIPSTDEAGNDILDWEENAVDLPNGLAAGGEARVLLRFCFRPELIFEDDKQKLIFKESRTKGVGSIVKTTDTVHVALDNKLVTKDSKQRITRRQRKLLHDQLRLEYEAQGIPMPGQRRKVPAKVKVDTLTI